MKRSGILAITLVGIIMSMVLVFPNVSKEFSDKNTNQNILDTKVRSAVKMIESGEGNPMEAIFALREVVEVDSNHRDAQFYLGQFSIMSGQWNKAIDRFKKVLRINSSDEYAIESLAIARFQKGEKNGKRKSESLLSINREHIFSQPPRFCCSDLNSTTQAYSSSVGSGHPFSSK